MEAAGHNLRHVLFLAFLVWTLVPTEFALLLR
jgi:hypothetical protein